MFSCTCIFAKDNLPPFEWQKINDNVYVALKPQPHRFIDSNVVIIDTKQGLTLVDAYDNFENAQILANEIKTRFNKPVIRVINTHWHSDHTLSNDIYKQNFSNLNTFVGHESLPNLIDTKTKEQLNEKISSWETAISKANKKLEQSPDNIELEKKINKTKQRLEKLKNISLIKPNVVFKDKLILNEGTEYEIHLLNFGRAHTQGDTTIYLPHEKIIISGDLFDQIPFAGHGFPKEWLYTLQQINQLDFKLVIPGHGEIQQGKTQLEKVIALLEYSITSAQSALKDNLSEEEFLKSVDINEFREALTTEESLSQRVYDHFIKDFFQRAYQQEKESIKSK